VSVHPWPDALRAPVQERYQKVLNEQWPQRPREFEWHSPRIPVWVRVVWEDDGEEWCAGHADRWNDHHVHVWFDNEPRSLTGGTWVLARNVRRRVVPND
jgi:hypothetical protein